MAVELEGGGVDGFCPEGRKVDFQASAACQPRTITTGSTYLSSTLLNISSTGRLGARLPLSGVSAPP